jgi:hypothetical protein
MCPNLAFTRCICLVALLGTYSRFHSLIGLSLVLAIEPLMLVALSWIPMDTWSRLSPFDVALF